MQVKRFVAADMRRALEMVRLELGADAIILSSSRVPDGVEILTTTGSDSELEQLQQNPPTPYLRAAPKPALSAPRPASTRSQPADVRAAKPSPLAQGKTGLELAADIEKARRKLIATQQAQDSAAEFLTPMQTNTSRKIASQPQANRSKPSVDVKLSRQGQRLSGQSAGQGLDLGKVSAAERYPLVDNQVVDSQMTRGDKPNPVSAVQSGQSDRELRELQAEIADMRSLLEQQFDRMGLGQKNSMPAQFAQSPVLSSVGRRLERLGLPQGVVTNLLNHCQKATALSDAWPDALANLAHQLPVKNKDIVEQGGIFALVGPTGSGKTTTIGKLAARYVLAHGSEKVALITTDTYRIAAHDQLRSLARILRVPVRVVDEANSLESLLRSLRHCSLILIDTAGFRQGDPHLKAQLKQLQAIPQIKTLLVMSCNSQAQMLKASVHAYGVAKLQGCVLTKLDETASMGEALGVTIEHQLPIAYTTDGQDIPKNLSVARAHQLVAKAAALLKTQASAAAS